MGGSGLQVSVAQGLLISQQVEVATALATSQWIAMQNAAVSTMSPQTLQTVLTDPSAVARLLPQLGNVPASSGPLQLLASQGNGVTTTPSMTVLPSAPEGTAIPLAAAPLRMGGEVVFFRLQPSVGSLPHVTHPLSAIIDQAATVVARTPLPTTDGQTVRENLPVPLPSLMQESRPVPARVPDFVLPRASESAKGSVDSQFLPEVVWELLARLDFLPPGTRTEEALTRFGEVLRLWVQESRHADLPPDVVRVVNQFFASAVFAVASRAIHTPSQMVPGERGMGRQGNLSEQARPAGTSFGDIRFSSLTAQKIAGAVFQILSRYLPQGVPQRQGPTPQLPQGMTAFPSRPLPTETPSLPSARQPASARQEAKAPATGNLLQGPEREGERTRSRTARFFEGSLPAAREEGEEAPVFVPGRPTERDPFAGSGEQEQEREALPEAVWERLQEELSRGRFIDQESGAIRGLRTVEEGKALLQRLSGLVSPGLDLIDLLNLINHKIGWSERSGAINVALFRLANYQRGFGANKMQALWEPLGDVTMTLDQVEGGLLSLEESEISALDLMGFEIHLEVVRMFLDRPSWLAALPLDRSFRTAEEQQAGLREFLQTARGLIGKYWQVFVNEAADKTWGWNLFHSFDQPRPAELLN